MYTNKFKLSKKITNYNFIQSIKYNINNIIIHVYLMENVT